MPNVGTLSASMYLDTSPYIAGLNQAADSTRMFQTGVERISFASFHRGIFATTTLLYGLNRIMSSMSQGMEEYTNMLGRIGSVADLTAASVEALADSMKKLSVAQGVSRTDIMGGMYTAAQSGFSSPAEMRAMAKSGALLSRASGKEIDVKKAVDLMSVARQALGIGQGAVTSNRMTDLLLRGRDVGRWELDEMAQALGIPLTVYGNQFASKIGGEETLRQLVAIMSTATLAGLNPRMAATGTRRLVERTVQLNKTKLGDPLRQALRGAGFNGGDPISAALDQGPMAYLNTLQQLTGGSTNELNRLGYGSRDLMVLTSALRGKGQTLNQLYEELSYGNAAGTTDRYNRKMQGTYDYARDRLRAQWEITNQEFMQASVPLITQFTSMLGGLNDVAQRLPESAKSFMLLIGALTSLRLALNFLGFRGSMFHGFGQGAMTGATRASGVSGSAAAAVAARGAVEGLNARWGGRNNLGVNPQWSGNLWPSGRSRYEIVPSSVGPYAPFRHVSSHVGVSVPFDGMMGAFLPTAGMMGAFLPSSGNIGLRTPSSGNIGRYLPSSFLRRMGIPPSSGNIGAHTPSSGNIGSFTPTSYRPLSSGNIGAYTPSSGNIGLRIPSSGQMPVFNPGLYMPPRTPSSGRRFATPAAGNVGSYLPTSNFLFAAQRNDPFYRTQYHAPVQRRPTFAPMPYSGLGANVGANISAGAGAVGGSMMGSYLEGEDGSGLLPMMLGMGGMQLAGNLWNSASSSFSQAGMKGLTMRLGTRTLPSALALGALTTGGRIAGGAFFGRKIPKDADEDKRMETDALLRKRSSFGVGRFLENVWQTLPAIGQRLREDPFMRQSDAEAMNSPALKRIARIWMSPSKEQLYSKFISPGLTKSSKDYLAANKIDGIGSLLGNKKFLGAFQEQFGDENYKKVIEGDLFKTNPAAFVDILTDGLNQISKASSDAAKQATELAEAEKILDRIRDISKNDIRKLSAYTSGTETLMALEGYQTKPFQMPRGAKWQSQYDKAVGQFGSVYNTPLPISESYIDESIAKIRESSGGRTNKGAEATHKGAADWIDRLRAMNFLAKNGKNLKSTDDASIIGAFGLDKENMGPEMMQQVLGRVRGLDYTQWTQTFAQPKAPFSSALTYGSKEGYNATLERKDNYVVQILSSKLKDIVDAVTVLDKNSQEAQTSFEDHLRTILSNDVTAPIVDAVNNLGTETFPSTIEE